MSDERRVLLGHGSGGTLSHALVRDLFLRHLGNPLLAPLGDSALLDLGAEGRLAFTTDSYVIAPPVFPGGDIGRLAVCGTVNDLAVCGARALYLSAGFILEEGLSLDLLEQVVVSMARTAEEAGVRVVTGDTKVVERGAADGLFVNTAGIGLVPAERELSVQSLRPGDHLLVSGTLGDHGLAVMMAREGLGLRSSLVSDCAPLNGLIEALLAACPNGIRCMRDPTRGGLATTLNEWAQAAGVHLVVRQEALPVRAEVRAACELLGLDALYAANEGKVLLAAAPEAARAALAALRAHPLGRDAAEFGVVTQGRAGRVVLETPYGARRVLDMLAGEQLPRIC
ncbi:MAG: hydrogenase expression/formation protein HypE [Anaerolineae bacterium]